ncbi:MAG: hypothetical protein KBT33_00330 [Prevotellaceae bacterium]|nr:hypothetical protein [Candidatus Minthosoma equi]
MRKNIFAIILAFVAVTVNAQNGINSPYSRYGFGLQSERAMGFNKGMGGVAQGFRNGHQINVANPASYSEVDSLTALFDMGISLQNGNFKMGNLQQNAKNSSLDYFAYQFRAAKNVGMTLGILPVTNIKYNFASSSESLEGTEDVTSTYSFSGDGGLREVFLGAGWRPFKPISIGFNVSYLWGEYNHKMSMAFSQSSAFSMARIYSADISTYNVQGGIQYIQPINKKDKIVIGATATLGHNLANKAYRQTQTLNSSTIETSTSDTIKNAFRLPHSIAVGATYYNSNKLRIGADIEYQKWSTCKFPVQETSISTNTDKYVSKPGQLNNKIKYALGLDYLPNSLSNSYFSRCTYKVGSYYSQSYAKADLSGTIKDKPYELGVSAGITFPIGNANIYFKQNQPKINVAFQWVHTNIPYLNSATMRQSALTENYLKLCIGVTFSDRWFYKWKAQ